MSRSASTPIVVAIAVVAVVLVAASALMKAAADDLAVLVAQTTGQSVERPRWDPHIWLSTPLASGIAEDDVHQLAERAFQLSYRSERIREGASVLALVGLLIALLTDRSAISAPRGASSPTAKTTSRS